MTTMTTSSAKTYTSYIVGFILSVIMTLVAFFMVISDVWPKEALIYAVLAIAVAQLIVQMIFFLHVGRGSRWKALTFYFTLLIIIIIVVGTIWIMHHLDYNMMHMPADEMKQYMHENQGL